MNLVRSNAEDVVVESTTCTLPRYCTAPGATHTTRTAALALLREGDIRGAVKAATVLRGVRRARACSLPPSRDRGRAGWAGDLHRGASGRSW